MRFSPIWTRVHSFAIRSKFHLSRYREPSPSIYITDYHLLSFLHQVTSTPSCELIPCRSSWRRQRGIDRWCRNGVELLKRATSVTPEASDVELPTCAAPTTWPRATPTVRHVLNMGSHARGSASPAGKRLAWSGGRSRMEGEVRVREEGTCASMLLCERIG